MYANALALGLVTAVDTGAKSSDFSGGDLINFLQFGVVGLLVVLFMTRKGIVPEWTLRVAEERAAAERATLLEAATAERLDLAKRLSDKEAQVERLQGIYEDVVLPALFRATEANLHYEEQAGRAADRPSSRTARTRRAPTARDGDDGES